LKIRTFITTYEREEMLCNLVEHLNSFDIIPIIKDDGSTYEINLPQYFRHEHRGKDGFWLTWDEMLKDCKDKETSRPNADLFLFLADDFKDLDVKRILELHEKYKDSPYVYNILNDGRSGHWTGIQERQVDEQTIMCGMVDCGFFCNYSAIMKLGYYMHSPTKQWKDKGLSSGVGMMLSKRFMRSRVLMYKPVKSLAYHGTHESKMHPEERKRNPLISL
jgi:hypothetical protein